MLDVQADLGGLMGPIVIGILLMTGAWAAVRSADTRPPHGRHRSHSRSSAKPKRPRRSMPAPVAGGAAGLLESIPFLQPVKRRRLRGTARLGTTLVLAAACVATALFMLGRAFVNWLSTYQP